MPNRLTTRVTKAAVCLALVASFLVGCATPKEEAEVADQPTFAPGPVATEALRASLHDAAAAAQRSGDYAAALSFYNSLHNRNPNDLKAAIGLAHNLRYIGATEPAIRILEATLADNPDEPSLVSELGKVQLAGGLPEQAIASLTRARELVPDDWRIHSALGIAYDRLGKYQAARLSYQAALDLSPANVTVLNNLALSHVQTEELERGIELLTRAVALPRAGVQVRQNLALLYALRGDIDEAEKLARQDLPEDMVQKNLAYYRELIAARSEADSRRPMQPVPETTSPATGTVPVRLDPWEEDTEAERAATVAKDAD